MTNIILFGPPGSGKGTQAIKLASKYNLLHISTGDLFRFNLKNNTPLGKEAKTYIDQGNLVPDSITIGMLKQKVQENKNVEGYIFDGFPRTIPQAEALNLLLGEDNQSISALIALDVDDEEIVKRLLERGKTSGRADDTDESIIRNRIDVYNKETNPVFSFYQETGHSLKVNGIGDIDEVSKRLNDIIDTLV